ncbi:Uncharacterized protein PECH_000387 [Penicillium ucsense]|uniref:Uncharacterized protein n=1 Tax=Penicillium ucsense TaxID=2839758 RepID=A0A8J8WIA2_9EURO|nr:Uncharacterized protein PECM_004273 [Penicillium ucsense]KAF7733612.1 Uncharacterized protein PECH_000387 [Penicillium ucsense]
MFDSTTASTATATTTSALSLHRLSRQSLQHRYESDEEEMSESDTGANDFTPSLTSSPQRANHFDYSDTSADEASPEELDLTQKELLVFLPPDRDVKRQRPVSLDTVKRNSVASYAEAAYIFDPEEPVVLGLPSSDGSDDLLDASLYLRPTVYQAPDVSSCVSKLRSRSASPASIFSIDQAEIQTAKKITLTEPTVRPALVFINSLAPRMKNARSRTRKTSRDRESRILDGRLMDNSRDVYRSNEIKAIPVSPITESVEPASPKNSSSQTMSDISTFEQARNDNDSTPPPSQSATIHSVSEIPTIPILPHSPHLRSQSMHRLRPRTASNDASSPAMPSPRSRRPTDAGLRPPSIRSNSNSNSNSSVPSFSSRPTSPFFTDLNYIPDHSFSETGSVLSRTCSPLSCASSPPPPPFYQLPTQPSKRGHASSKSSVSSLFSQRSPMLQRMTTRKHSTTSSIYSTSSLRSEVDLFRATGTPSIPSSHTQACLASAKNVDAAAGSKSSENSNRPRHERHNSVAVTGRTFMGLKLGKRSFTKS